MTLTTDRDRVKGGSDLDPSTNQFSPAADGLGGRGHAYLPTRGLLARYPRTDHRGGVNLVPFRLGHHWGSTALDLAAGVSVFGD